MSAEVKKEIELEIAHVLFLDIVGYSKLSVNEQHARVEELNQVVRLSEQFRKAEAAGRLLKIPTGDVMALVFYKSPEEPAQCAVEISRALKCAGQRLQSRCSCWERLSAARFSFCAARSARCQVLPIKASQCCHSKI